MNHIIILEIDFNFGETEDKIYPVVLKDEHKTVLVDCGYAGSLIKIEDSLIKNNVNPKHITDIIITHHDHDHIGALADFKEKYPNVNIISSKKEALFISGKEKSPRLIQAEELQKILPEDKKKFGNRFIKMLENIKPVNVDIEVEPDDVLDICGGCKVLNTSGHTHGHISLLLDKLNTLITGDAGILEKGKLKIANPHFTLDMINADKSLKLIKSASVNTIICYHGGVLKK